MRVHSKGGKDIPPLEPGFPVLFQGIVDTPPHGNSGSRKSNLSPHSFELEEDPRRLSRHLIFMMSSQPNGVLRQRGTGGHYSIVAGFRTRNSLKQFGQILLAKMTS